MGFWSMINIHITSTLEKTEHITTDIIIYTHWHWFAWLRSTRLYVLILLLERKPQTYVNTHTLTRVLAMRLIRSYLSSHEFEQLTTRQMLYAHQIINTVSRIHIFININNDAPRVWTSNYQRSLLSTLFVVFW